MTAIFKSYMCCCCCCTNLPSAICFTVTNSASRNLIYIFATAITIFLSYANISLFPVKSSLSTQKPQSPNSGC